MIGAGFTVKPKLPTPFPTNRTHWTCPKTGLVVPKTMEENMQYREKLLHAANDDRLLQQDLLTACSHSCLYFVNTFMYTRHEFEVSTTNRSGKRPSVVTHWPFLTWEIQDDLFIWLEEHFNNGESGLIDKSRDMGASWCGLGFNHWLWLFRPNTEIREMSRSEAYVDSPVAKSLFFKHDYINTWLPEWMRPPGVLRKGRENRTAMRIHNELNGSTIAGESTTKHAMSADRCSLLFLDEFSKVENGEEIKTATFAAAGCRIVNSTVAGPGTAYSRWKNSGQIDIFPLMFWDHPQKGENRFVIHDEGTNTYKISSPWLECVKKDCSDKEIAQEQYAIDAEAGDMFFDLHLIRQHAAMFGRESIGEYNILLKGSIPDEDVSRYIQQRDIKAMSVKPAPNGKLKLWVNLIDGRLDQSFTYTFGIDTSKGQGGSDSVVTIRCKQTGEKVARWSCNNTLVHDFARIVVALAIWCGGANPQRLPYLKWEKNGPGWELGRLLVHVFKYPYYHITKTLGVVVEKVAGTKGEMQKYGWQSSREGKEILLREYERALRNGKIVNHDIESLKQAELYIYMQDGSIGPAELVDSTAAEKKQHGDITMADALSVDDEDVSNPKFESVKVPANSFEGRKRAHFAKMKRKKRQQRGWYRKYNYAR